MVAPVQEAHFRGLPLRDIALGCLRDMNELVGGLHAPRETIERCRYPHSTWHRIHAEASKLLAAIPEEKARQEQFLEMFLATA